ncbi:Hypothetical protein SRAE_2000270050 [Strongyloides ratti]|uniref:Uncharacterized protein n=1 Tax=Strongyloides ratti TaxID=34506 RepID=A0A090LKF5_STRRB|nr:Hypothetical protein SRAE_2000270050 [Strongyloides ratti]CEF68040.1 Hypothetical protein SRAE_2000270050 [Strongyloides ratti]
MYPENSQIIGIKKSTNNEYYISESNSQPIFDKPLQSSSGTDNNSRNYRLFNVRNQLQYDYYNNNENKIGHFWLTCGSYNCGRGKK